MARMIPPVLDPNTASQGEREVYKRLRNEPFGKDWIVIHSLNIAHHVRQVEGEADFVVIVPALGVLCLEVKAHPEIKRKDGLWYYGIGGAPDPRGPFKQASQAMHSIRTMLTRRHPDLSSVLWWSAVIFPYASFKTLSDEWHPWQVIDNRAFRSGALTNMLAHVISQARMHLEVTPTARWFNPEYEGPTLAQCGAIAHALRPNFEFYESLRARADRRESELKRFTEEQYAALDAMETNPRVVFAGPAGTGKTVLALEAARRATLHGRRTLFLCYNRLLAKWLKHETAPLGPSLQVGTLHSYLLDLAGADLPKRPESDFWQTALPELALHAMLSRPTSDLFDELIVDEAQDMLRGSYLDLLDLSLTGGLSAGRWRFFGDFEKQALYDAADSSLDDFIATRDSKAPRYLLRVNCRNVPRISSLVGLLAGLRPAYSRVLREDNGVEPDVRYFAGIEHEVPLLTDALETLYKEGFRGSDIVVLSPRSNDACVDRLPQGIWRDRIRPVDVAGPGNIRSCTVHSFKGLESPAIILTDVETIRGPRAEAIFYTAITRALDRLIILVDTKVRAEVVEILTETEPRQSRGIAKQRA